IMFSFHYYDFFYPHAIASFLYYLSTFYHNRFEKKSRKGLLNLLKRFERIKKDSIISHRLPNLYVTYLLVQYFYLYTTTTPVTGSFRFLVHQYINTISFTVSTSVACNCFSIAFYPYFRSKRDHARVNSNHFAAIC